MLIYRFRARKNAEQNAEQSAKQKHRESNDISRFLPGKWRTGAASSPFHYTLAKGCPTLKLDGGLRPAAVGPSSSRFANLALYVEILQPTRWSVNRFICTHGVTNYVDIIFQFPKCVCLHDHDLQRSWSSFGAVDCLGGRRRPLDHWSHVGARTSTITQGCCWQT